ncbi:MAG TPA: ABC transporter substrate-binding protein, partial [Propionibacteriaceae bacterium]|nr:ABC transporter substrate-binding protein [Propionibacteriaceae bacterium]
MSDSVFSTPSRRSLLKLGGVVAGGLALAACSKKGGTTGGASGGSAGTLPGIGNNGQVGKGRTQNADTLFIAGFQWGPPTTYNPFSPTAAWPASGNVMQIVYESLLRWNILTGEILPGLAKSYKVDGTSTITLTMQDGVTFNDGSPCTAKDAAFSFNIGKTATGVSVASFFQAADSIDATDDKTLVIKVNQTKKNVGQVLRLLTET